MDTLNEKLIGTVIRHVVEELPRTRSGRGYIFLSPVVSSFGEQKQISIDHIVNAIVRILKEKHLIKTEPGVSELIRASVKSSIFSHTVNVYDWEKSGGDQQVRTRRVVSEGAKEDLVKTVLRHIRQVEALPEGLALFFLGLHLYM
jgi:hypothetical protein